MPSDVVMKEAPEKPEVSRFPVFMINGSVDLIVLFTDANAGMVVWSAQGENRKNFVGQCKDSWCIDNFKPFNGTITIESS